MPESIVNEESLADKMVLLSYFSGTEWLFSGPCAAVKPAKSTKLTSMLLGEKVFSKVHAARAGNTYEASMLRVSCKMENETNCTKQENHETHSNF